MASLIAALEHSLPEAARSDWQRRADALAGQGVPAELARRAAGLRLLYPALDIVQVAEASDSALGLAAEAYFLALDRLGLGWLSAAIRNFQPANGWQERYRAGLDDELYRHLRQLSCQILTGTGGDGAGERVERWLGDNHQPHRTPAGDTGRAARHRAARSGDAGGGAAGAQTTGGHGHCAALNKENTMTEALDLHYSSLGEGEPLLVLHGLYGSGNNWNSQAKALAERYRVILPDLRNHGRSPQHPDMSYPAMAADLERLLDTLELDSALVLGHSMGGKAAMLLALTRPERVRTLIAADIAPVAYRHDHREIIDSLLSLDLFRVASRAAADQALAADIRSPMVRQFLLTNLVREGDRYAWRIPLGVLSDQLPLIEGFPPVEGVYQGPALFVHGAASDYVSTESVPVIRRHFPKAEIVPIADAGHWLHVEQPQAFAKALEAFLKSH